VYQGSPDMRGRTAGGRRVDGGAVHRAAEVVIDLPVCRVDPCLPRNVSRFDPVPSLEPVGPPAAGRGGQAWYEGRVELAAWLVDDLAAVRARFLNAIAAHVPEDRWAERADGGGSSIAALLLHVTVHQDLAVRTALGGQAPRFAAVAADLGLDAGASPLASLQEAEDPELTRALDLAAVQGYAAEVHDEVTSVLARLTAAELEAQAPASERLGTVGGVQYDDAPWLYAMWDGKPAAWFVRWELIGHVQGHVGEMVSVRDRLGFRPF
jgi:DinB superfamily